LIVHELLRQKPPEEALRESEERLRVLGNHLSAIFWATDSNLRITWSVGAGLYAVNLRPHQLVGATLFEALQSNDPTYLPIAAHLRALQGETVKYSLEWRGRTFESRIEPLCASDGTVAGCIGVSQDVTERKQAEALLAGEARILALVSMGARLSDALDCLVRTAEELAPGMLASILMLHDGKLHHGAAPSLPETYNRAVEGIAIGPCAGSCGTAAYRRELVVVADIEADPLWAACREIPLAHGLRACWSAPILSGERVYGTFALYYHEPRQPTANELRLIERLIHLAHIAFERKQAEEERRKLEMQLLHAQKLESLGVLAGGIAHDFNNLLTGMLGYATLARGELPPESPAAPLLGELERIVLRAADLAQQMLAYAGKGRLVKRPCNLSQLVQEMTRMLSTALSKKADLRLELDPALPVIEGDAAQLRQVMMNLLTNASDALGEDNGIIVVRTRVVFGDAALFRGNYLHDELPTGDYVCVEIADSGCGMTEETMARIFEPFFTTKFTGRGLGLAATLGIIRGHRGAIQVSSQPGHGSTFRVLFPCAGPSAVELPAPPAAKPWRGEGTILVVDDEEPVRSVARHALARAGFRVLLARDGREGVEVFQRNRADIVAVLLDLTMPRLGGLEALAEMRQLQPDVCAVLMSGFSVDDVSRRFADQHLAGCVQKPFVLDDLLALLRRAIDQSGSAGDPDRQTTPATAK
jgi:signal transduction histidine kinase/ActR/RegA family two-component response regulator